VFRLFVSPPELLKVGNLVKFVGEFTDEITDGTIVEVQNAVVVNFRKGFVIPPEDRIEILFDNSDKGLKLYPTSTDTFYEILMGFKADGSFLMYPQFPAGHYPFRLQESTMYPDTDANDYRKYVGAFKPEDSPINEPKLRTYTLKSLEPLVLEISNEGSDYGKLIIEFTINKVQFRKVPLAELEGYEIVYREVLHPELMEW